MTLIVARRSGNTIALVSDTGISHHGQKLDPKQFVPKITIINPDVAVEFAGSAELGIRAVTSVPSSSSYRQVVDFSSLKI